MTFLQLCESVRLHARAFDSGIHAGWRTEAGVLRSTTDQTSLARASWREINV